MPRYVKLKLPTVVMARCRKSILDGCLFALVVCRNTEWAKDTNIIRDQVGYLVTGADLLKEGYPPQCWKLDRDPFFLETSVPGSFAAGDVRHGSVKRVAFSRW
jgi:thioredoxin reductase